MKLYLSSYRVPVVDALTALLPNTPQKTKMVIIPNAGDYYATRAQNYKIQEVCTYFRLLGFQPEVVDLRKHDKASLAAALENAELIWATGGNTFCLRYEMQRSGFEELLGPLLKRGVVYGGDSAGAIVVGPTLKGVEFADEPEFAEAHIEEGVGVIPDIVIPHADNMSFGDSITRMIELYKEDERAVILNDNQALVIDGNHRQIVTAPSPE